VIGGDQVTVKEIAEWLMADSRRIVAFGKSTDESWCTSLQRLRQIEGGAFMSQDEVNFFLSSGCQLAEEQRVNQMYEMEMSALQHEAHDHAQGFGL